MSEAYRRRARGVKSGSLVDVAFKPIIANGTNSASLTVIAEMDSGLVRGQAVSVDRRAGPPPAAAAGPRTCATPMGQGARRSGRLRRSRVPGRAALPYGAEASQALSFARARTQRG